MAVQFDFSIHLKPNFANLFFSLSIFNFISGELEVARAKNVILYTTLSNKSQDRELNGLCGLLVVTNFKLSFLTSDNEQVSGLIAKQSPLLLSCATPNVCPFYPFPRRILRIRRTFSCNATMSPCRTLTESIR